MTIPPISSAVAQSERFSRLEDPSSDFPFYGGAPSSISGRQWLFVMAMVVVGFLVLASPINWPYGVFWQFIPAILMPGIPLLALAYVARGHWMAIFGKVGSREVKLMVAFALLNIIVTKLEAIHLPFIVKSFERILAAEHLALAGTVPCR